MTHEKHLPLRHLPRSPSAIQIAAMVSVQVEKGIPEEEIRKSLDLDDKFDIDIPLYIEFCIENDIVVKDTESGKYKITSYGREFIAAFLPAGDE